MHPAIAEKRQSLATLCRRFGVQRLEVWIDSVKKYQKWNDQLAKKFTLSAGTHRIAVVAVDAYKGTATKAITVTVH